MKSLGHSPKMQRNASPRLASLVTGVALADSWATDGHKWLNTPYDCGMAITRDPAAHSAAMRMTAAYLTSGGDVRDPMDFTPEWSRRARALPALAALMELGRDGLAASRWEEKPYLRVRRHRLHLEPVAPRHGDNRDQPRARHTTATRLETLPSKWRQSLARRSLAVAGSLALLNHPSHKG